MNKYIKAISSNYILFLVSTVFFLVITGVAIRVMGEEFYGLWVILNSILLFSNVGMLGMGMIVNKFASEVGEEAYPANSILSTGFALLLPVACLAALTIWLLRDWIVVQMGVDAALQEQFRLALVFTAISVIPQFLSRVLHGYLLSQLKNLQSRWIEFAVNFALWTGATIIAALLQDLVWMAAWGLVVQAAGMLSLMALVFPQVGFRWELDRSLLRKMLDFSGFTFLQSIANILFQHFDRILVGFVLGPAAAGVYSVGNSVALRLSIVSGQAAEVMLPYASKKGSVQDRTALYQTFRQLNQFIGILIGALAALLILWMEPILAVWISQDYARNYAAIFRILILAYVFMSVCRSGHQTLTGIGKIKAISLIYIGSSLLMLLGLYLLASRFGLVGAALANLLMVFLLLFNILVYPELTGRLPIGAVAWDLLLALGFPALAYGFMLFVHMPSILTMIVISVGLLFLAVALLRRLHLVRRYENLILEAVKTKVRDMQAGNLDL